MIDLHLQKIAALQCKGQHFYADGLFPSQRYYFNYWPWRREDNNIFFTAILCFLLRDISSRLSESQQEQVRQICQKAEVNYPDYRSKKGKHSFNFWRTHPPQFFPNGRVFRHFSKFELPDDADDSVMIYLSKKFSQAEARDLKMKLEASSIRKAHQYKNFPKAYQAYDAYATFLATDQMPLDHSICVLCNILYFVKAYELAWTKWDSESVRLLVDAVQSRDYLRHSAELALHYPSAPIIIYHYARLIQTFDIKALRELKTTLLQDGRELMQRSSKILERIVLASALIKLGAEPRDFELREPSNKEFKIFPFFMFSHLSYFSPEWIRKLSRYPFFQVYYTSEAYNRALYLEYLLLQNQSLL